MVETATDFVGMFIYFGFICNEFEIISSKVQLYCLVGIIQSSCFTSTFFVYGMASVTTIPVAFVIKVQKSV